MSGGAWNYNRFDLYEKNNAKPDYLDMDKDGDKKESMKKAIGEKGTCKKCEESKSDCECNEETINEMDYQAPPQPPAQVRPAAAKSGAKNPGLTLKDAKKSMGVGAAMLGTMAGAAASANKKKPKVKPVFKEDALNEKSSCGGGYQMGGTVGYQKGGEVKGKKKKVVKEDVLEYMLENSLANNVVSAEVLFDHISDEFLESIEEEIMEGYMPLPKEKMARQANKAYGKEQQAVKAGDEAGANKQMQRRIAMKDPSGRKAQLQKGM